MRKDFSRLVLSLDFVLSELGKTDAQSLLNTFKCDIDDDKDLESFLHKKAIRFEKASKARTFLIFDKKDFRGSQKPVIYGYITLGLKILQFSDNCSKSFLKKIDGYSATKKGELITEFPGFLIGQLAKNSSIEDNPVNAKMLFDLADTLIIEAQKYIGGRFIMAECRDVPELVSLYENNGFEFIGDSQDNGNTMKQMLKKVPKII